LPSTGATDPANALASGVYFYRVTAAGRNHHAQDGDREVTPGLDFP
jgi:hypothetical protein